MAGFYHYRQKQSRSISKVSEYNRSQELNGIVIIILMGIENTLNNSGLKSNSRNRYAMNKTVEHKTTDIISPVYQPE
jgi:hypothetical protein